MKRLFTLWWLTRDSAVILDFGDKNIHECLCLMNSIYMWNYCQLSLNQGFKWIIYAGDKPSPSKAGDKPSPSKKHADAADHKVLRLPMTTWVTHCELGVTSKIRQVAGPPLSLSTVQRHTKPCLWKHLRQQITTFLFRSQAKLPNYVCVWLIKCPCSVYCCIFDEVKMK